MKDKSISKAQLIEEVSKLREQVAELRAIAIEKKQEKAKVWGVFESAPDAILIINSSGCIELVNAQTEKQFGYNRYELLGQPVEILIPPRFREAHVGHRADYFTNPRTRPMGAGLDLFARCKDGSELPVEISLSPLETEEGFFIISIIRDITERKKSKDALREAYDQLERRVEERTAELLAANVTLNEQAALLGIVPDAILVSDLSDKILFWNRGAERLYGWTAAEAIGRNVNELFYREVTPQLLAISKNVIETGEWVGELRQVTKDGKEISIESRRVLMRDAEGRPKSQLIVNTDITEKKRLAAQFLRTQRMESIGTLATGIAHDLNNSLTPIAVGIQLLRSRLTEEHHNLLNGISAAIEQCTDLVRQVLSFVRGAKGTRVIFQPGNLIKEVKKFLNQTLPKSIAVYAVVQKDLWPIAGDITQVHQMLINLCINARDTMPDGGKLIIEAGNVIPGKDIARGQIEAAPVPSVFIKVTDTGKGVPADIMDKIFEPFFTTKEIGSGTGLGLSTAAEIAKSHGGFIDLHSEAGKGTQVIVYLPAAVAPIEQATESRSELPVGNNELILVADDEASIREITRITLEAYGYKVMTAGDGVELLALYAKNIDRVKLVLMDMVMPYLDGLATARTLEKLDPKVKIISSSGFITNDEFAETASPVVKAFLRKPYTLEKLLTAISKVLNEE